MHRDEAEEVGHSPQGIIGRIIEWSYVEIICIELRVRRIPSADFRSKKRRISLHCLFVPCFCLFEVYSQILAKVCPSFGFYSADPFQTQKRAW